VTIVAALLVAGIGLLIGTVGLGGFLMVPVLMFMEGVTVRQAVVVAAVAFLAAGLTSLALWQRSAPDDARPYHAFLGAAAPGAILGALAVGAMADSVLTTLIAAAFLIAGVAEWLGWPRNVQQQPVTAVQAAAGGVATGFGSALTGTSGPMVAMPLLAWAGLPTRERIALGQVVQIPIALGATLAFASFGEVPWTLAAWCSLALCVGLVTGAFVTRSMKTSWLRRVAAVLMVGAAASMIVKL